MNKPRNWYDMSYEERNAWETQKREYDDLEYEKERENAESAQRQAADERRKLAQARTAHAEEVEEYSDRLREAESELALAHQWLREKGLWAEFDDWACTRRE